MPIPQWLESITNAVTDGKIAAVIREQVTLIELRLEDATRELDKAKADLAVKSNELKDRSKECLELRKELAAATTEIETLKNGNSDLPEEAVELLRLIAHTKEVSGQLVARLRVTRAKFDHYIDLLDQAGFVGLSGVSRAGTQFHATSKGREYLARKNLL